MEESRSIDIQVDNIKLQERKAVVGIIRLVPMNGILLDAQKDIFIVIEVSQADITEIDVVEISFKDKNK